jgi:hypothetical protein
LPVRATVKTIAIHFDWLVQATVIGVPHNVGHSLVNRPNDFPDVFPGKFQHFHQGRESSADHAEQTWMTAQLEL